MKRRTALFVALAFSLLLLGEAYGSGESPDTEFRTPWYDEGPVIRVGAEEGWEATCKNGAQVRLLAIGTKCPGPDPTAEEATPVDGVYWVDPGGKPTKAYPNFLDVGRGAIRGDWQEAYEFVASINGDGITLYDWSLFAEPVAGNGFCINDSKLPEGIICVVNILPRDFYTSDVGLLIAAGPWTTIFESIQDADGKWEDSIKDTTFGSVCLEAPFERDGKLLVSVVHHVALGKRYQYNLFAIDTSGREDRLQHEVEDRTAEGEVTTYKLPVPVNDLKALQFRVRPREHIEFKEVTLRPAPKQDLKWGTLSDEARNIVREVGKKEGWVAPFELGPAVELHGVSHFYAEHGITGWWSPDGSPLHPHPRFGRSSLVKEEDCISYRIAFEARPTQHSVRFRMDAGPDSPACADVELRNYRRRLNPHINLEGHIWQRLIVRPEVRSCSVRVGMAAGDFVERPYESILVKQGEWAPAALDTPEGLLSLAPVEETDGVSEFVVRYALKNADPHLLVQGKDGSLLASEETDFGIQEDGTRTMTVRVEAPKSEIAKVRLQTRPFEWALYRDIALRPVADEKAPES